MAYKSKAALEQFLEIIKNADQTFLNPDKVIDEQGKVRHRFAHGDLQSAGGASEFCRSLSLGDGRFLVRSDRRGTVGPLLEHRVRFTGDQIAVHGIRKAFCRASGHCNFFSLPDTSYYRRYGSDWYNNVTSKRVYIHFCLFTRKLCDGNTFI